MFVVMSDDTEWCERGLRCDDAVVMKTNFPAQDLAIMAKGKHFVIDYDTYGLFGGTILSGGDTFVYELTNSGAVVALVSLLPN